MRIYSKLIQLISPLVYFFSSPVLAFAKEGDVLVNPCPEQEPFRGLCRITGAGFGPFVGNMVNAIMIIAALVALGFLLYGGIKWIMSEGDKTAVETARQTIVGAIIGLVIVFLSYFILSIILSIFGIDLRTQLVIPRVTPLQ